MSKSDKLYKASISLGAAIHKLEESGDPGVRNIINGLREAQEELDDAMKPEVPEIKASVEHISSDFEEGGFGGHLTVRASINLGDSERDQKVRAWLGKGWNLRTVEDAVLGALGVKRK